METTENRTGTWEKNPVLYLFGFMGFSCFSICAIISLFIGIAWLSSERAVWEFDSWVNLGIPVVLIFWGLFPLVALILLYRRWQSRR